MEDSKKQEYNKILNTLGKKLTKSNRNILHYIENDIFPEEKEQQRHENNYFYKFVFYYFKDHLKDRTNLKNLTKEILENWLQITTNIVGIIFIITLTYCYILNKNIAINKWLSSGIVLLITSLVTGSFFLIKIYIENKLNRKEKEMLKEYQQALDKQTREQNLKFEEQNKRFDKLEELITDQQTKRKSNINSNKKNTSK